MSDNYPLYPSLPVEAQEAAQKLMDSFKVQMLAICEDTLSHLYTDITAYIESDHWDNFRNQLLDGFKNYDNRKIQAAYDFKAIRQAILKEHREDIISDLNQDLLAEIESLKKTISIMEEHRRGY